MKMESEKPKLKAESEPLEARVETTPIPTPSTSDWIRIFTEYDRNSEPYFCISPLSGYHLGYRPGRVIN